MQSNKVEENVLEDTSEDLSLQSYGSRLGFQCGLARRVLDPESEEYYDERWLECSWNKTWGPVDSLDPCVWIQCLHPPTPPETNRLEANWYGGPVEFNDSVSYGCNSSDTYFEWDRQMVEFNVTCLSGGMWIVPEEWPNCVESKHRRMLNIASIL